MGILIKDIQRNSNEIIRIEVSEFKGKELINLRIWFIADRDADGNNIYKPTQKGVALNISEFAELKDGIDRLQAYINDRKAGTMPEQLSGEKRVEDADDD
ncbi:MAG: transcriptional coactivator p15/PC4 family protein [Leptospirales bacterium]|nr:transcriptional coactivator p15/PC4 family protein [Leptospirales bacterium]